MTGTTTRLLRPDDAAGLAAVRTANRARLAPFEPRRSEAFYTEAGQRSTIDERLAAHAEGRGVPLAIVDDGDGVVGEMTLSGVVRGAYQSASVGYWVAEHVAGAGVASAALADAQAIAFGTLGLHRLQGETLVDNIASQTVLERAGFVRYGLAPDYLRIDGRWQAHVLYQCIASARPLPRVKE
ncbi:GNAT family N-acetyltransferase [Aeromicrobium fastidiosum]|uniref:GNAT family N-acetyltransferase n=1 Tax=Aeromicrobium fastidiosum TaxID=52699 RepID=UPI002023223C|nr:GNAT family protein [Aeromicrobium fastidiosum]MCL8250927.1 GNAT family N-acetyltransferase [Aeromicrobium fastidiosum]